MSIICSNCGKVCVACWTRLEGEAFNRTFGESECEHCGKQPGIPNEVFEKGKPTCPQCNKKVDCLWHDWLIPEEQAVCGDCSLERHSEFIAKQFSSFSREHP